MGEQVTARATLAAAPLALFSAGALAHHFMDNALPTTPFEGLLSGLGHPIIGLDHLAFLVATGFFLALMPRGSWGIAAVIGGSLTGAALHLAGIALPGSEAGVALSVILIGGLVIARRSIDFDWLMGGIAIASVLHGHAYAEAIFGAAPLPTLAYLAGFSLSQLGIVSAAYLMHRFIPRGSSLSPVLGAAVGAIGLVFLLSAP